MSDVNLVISVIRHYIIFHIMKRFDRECFTKMMVCAKIIKSELTKH